MKMEETNNDSNEKFYFKNFINKKKNYVIQKLELNRKYIQFAIVSIIIAILVIHISTLLFSLFPLIIFYTNNLIRLFMTVFSIFSFYTWLNLIYGNKYSLNDKKIFLLFLTCFISEFCIQFITFSKSEKYSQTRDILITNTQHVIIVSLICTLISYYQNYNLVKENFIYIALICSTRFYGSVYLSEIIPNTVCSYFTYLCALCGVLFSHFINSISMINDSLNLCNISISFTRKLNEYNSKNRNLGLQSSYKSIQQHKYNNKDFLFNRNLKNDTESSNVENNISDTSINENLLKSNRIRRKLSNSSLLNKRRTSLPTSISLKSEKENKYSQNFLYIEVERIVDDVLANNENLTIENYMKSLKKIKYLINSNLLGKLGDSKNQVAPRQINRNLNGDDDDDENKSSQLLIESKYFKPKTRRSLPISCPRRLSGFACSTTTSATGLPIDLPAARQRSLSLKCCSNNCEKLMANISLKNDELSDERYSNPIKILKETLSNSNYETKDFRNAKKVYDEDEDNIGISNSNNTNQIKTSDYESGESPTNSDYNSDTDKLQLKVINSFGSMIEHSVNKYKFIKENSDLLSYHNLICNKKLEQIKEEYYTNILNHNSNMNQNLININSNSSSDDNLAWQAEDLKDLDLLNYLHDWSFPIFQFYEKSNHNVISQMAYKIFDEVGLFKSFDIPITPFIQYFSALERGYIDLPYHNKIHAADVLHACYYLTTQAIPGLVQINDSVKVTNERVPLNPYQYSLKFSLTSNEIYGCTGANFSPLELLALYCSAAMHDYEHPGRNNQFLVSINSPLALLYNDRSVLENHHASASWLLLKSDPKYNFLTGLDAAEWKKFRFLILENILATDLSKHFSIISEFNQKSNIDTKRVGVLHKSIIPYDFESGIDWTNESDRLLCSQMILKLADINAPLKDKELHVQWTHRIVQEFYQQGDEELRLGLPISNYMDRRKPQVAKLQENFIHNLVATLCNSFTHAGLLPGFLIEDSETTDESDADGSSGITVTRQKPKIFYSELLSNIKSNYEMWREIVRQEQMNK